MAGIYEWIRSLTGFFLFMAAIDNLLPGTKYRKYLRLFSGMVLILLVMQPLTGSLRVEDTISRFYEMFSFQYETEDLKQELLGIEKRRMEQIARQYEEAVETDVTGMAQEEGLEALRCRAAIGTEEGTESFGTVTGIWMTVWEADGTEGGEALGRREESDGSDAPINPAEMGAAGRESLVDPVEIGAAGRERPIDPVEIEAVGREETETKAYPASRTADPKLSALRRRIQSYYHLEEEHVEIQLAEGQG